MQSSIYHLRGETDILLPGALEEAFTEFVSNSGMPFAPQVTHEDSTVRIHFLFLSKPLKTLADEFLATFEPDGFHTLEVAIPNDRIKHAIRVADEGQWISFTRYEGADRSRICFIRTPRSIPAAELEERIELVV